MPVFSRTNPSPRYRELAALYARMHVEGERRLGIPPQETFPGSSLLPHAPAIRHMISETGSRTILDYGAGKGLQYRPQRIVVDGKHVADSIAEYWDVDEVRCYDPGFAPHQSLPEGKFDGVVCTDVLEHCPEEDLPWILDEIFGYATQFAYLNVACFPARKTLPNGENAHVTVRPPEWWSARVAERSTGAIRWELHAAEISAGRVVDRTYRSDGFAATCDVDMDGRPARFHAPNEMTRWRAQTLYTKEPVTIEWLRTMPQSAVFVDVGANVGMYSIFAALTRNAQVYAFEPEAQNYALLNANIRLNALQERICAICAGLSERSGIDRLYLSEAVPGGSCHSLGSEVGFDLQPRRAAFVQGSASLRMDDLVAAGQLPIPDCVKIDVDGFEHKVIRGMERTIDDPRMRSMIVELNPALAEHREIRDFLTARGFGWDPQQVARAARKEGAFEGVAEHVFRR